MPDRVPPRDSPAPAANVLLVGTDEPLARAMGARCAAAPSPRDLDEAVVVILPEPDWAQLRAWRLGGRAFVARWTTRPAWSGAR